MSFRITTIADRGNLAKERLVLRASSTADIGDYAIFQAFASSDGGALAGDVLRAYWFTEKSIAAQDLVVLYTKDGTISEKKNKNGTTTHFFYWGLNEARWSDQYAAALVDTTSYEVFDIGDAPSE